MPSRQVKRLNLETLEARWVPATIRVFQGTLLVSNPVGTLTITPSNTTPGVVTVVDAGKAVTVSGVGGLIAVRGSNKADSILFNGDPVGFKGNLRINGGNGDDLISVTGITPGNVIILTGRGNDDVVLNGKIGGTLRTVNPNGLATIISPGDLIVGQNAALSGNTALQLLGTKFSVGGNFLLTGSAVSITGGGGMEIGKMLTVVGGNGPSNVGPFQNLTVGGNATFNLGEGNNTLNLITGLESVIAGDLNYLGGNGVNTISLGDNLIVAGNAVLDVGNGANNLAGLENEFAVYGNMTIRMGNGDNLAFTTLGTVAGNLSVFQGNGINGEVTIAFAPSGHLNYRGGNGEVSLRLGLGAVQTFRVDLFFGTGTNTLTLHENDTVTDSNTIEGSGGNNTFNQNDAKLVDITFVNFP